MFRQSKLGRRRLARGGTSRACLLVCLLLGGAGACQGYSLLTHEEIVDIVWHDQIQPLLLKHYPASTPDQLRHAHAYVYGGCVIQDMGYYPFGNIFFSDLAHCVRTGDFVANLLREAADLNEYAFALGALAHYASDNDGHPTVNHAVALCFPKLRTKFGDSVTYEDSPKAHIQTEFGFDITQVAKRRYTSERYHDFIGFQVSKPVLERAFLRTYGLPLKVVLPHLDFSINTFRRGASQVIPEMTRAALDAYHPQIVKEVPNFNERLFLYNLSRAQFEKDWGDEYRKPGFIARVLGLFVRWVPKIGIFDALAFKLPTPMTEDMYIKSVNRTVADYRRLLGEVAAGDINLPNLDCDTGRPAAPGEYALCDQTYALLLDAIVKHGLQDVPPDLSSNIFAFYAGMRMPERTRKEQRTFERISDELVALQAGPGSPVAQAIRARLLAPPPRLLSPKAKDA
jgi:Zinc dependent phospholipase C